MPDRKLHLMNEGESRSKGQTRFPWHVQASNNNNSNCLWAGSAGCSFLPCRWCRTYRGAYQGALYSTQELSRCLPGCSILALDLVTPVLALARQILAMTLCNGLKFGWRLHVPWQARVALWTRLVPVYKIQLSIRHELVWDIGQGALVWYRRCWLQLQRNSAAAWHSRHATKPSYASFYNF